MSWRCGVRSILAAALIGVSAFTGVPTASAQRGLAVPEAASGSSDKRLAIANSYMVAAANPLAVAAGTEMLSAGGSAVDAAIAVQLVLALVEPQSSGLGGGAFMVVRNGQAGTIATYDGRETAPAAARPERFVVRGRTMTFGDAVTSGLSVGVPGAVRLLEYAHRRHGRLPWPRLFAPAIALASEGFPVSDRLWLLLHMQGAKSFSAGARSYFFDERDDPRRSGRKLANPELAATLTAIAEQGSAGFYTGRIAESIVAAVRSAATGAGDLTLADLASYEVRERPPLCAGYRGYRVCGMGPPSSGALTIAQTLGLTEPMALPRGPGSAMNGQSLHVLAEALKLAFADRNFFVADPAFVTVPETLLDPKYLTERRRLIDPLATMAKPYPGVPPGFKVTLGDDATIEVAGTSHISVVDGDGNAVAMTTTIEAGFGSRLWAAGFLLNNQLTDFSLRPTDASGKAIANRVEPGKRPRSSMAPTIILDPQGGLYAVLGSPGGSRIIPYVLKAIVALIDWQLDPQAAAALPNFAVTEHSFVAELNAPGLFAALRVKPYGHDVVPDLMTSGLHIIVRRNGRLEGGADPRREGIAAGN